MYTLLLVDDEPLMRRGIKSLANLESLGIERILEAENGEEALRICETVEPDFALLDINMPKMDGLTCAGLLKEKYPQMSIAMITGYDYFDYARNALRAGVDDYILKPVSKKDIEALLVKLIQKKSKQAVQSQLNLLETTGEMPVRSESLESQLRDLVMRNLFLSDFTLTKLASDIGFSSGHLSGLFKQIYGKAFSDYVIEKRMDQAKILLLTTDMKNYEIADAIGIDDVNYFATRFKKTFGLTPKMYKQQVRG